MKSTPYRQEINERVIIVLQDDDNEERKNQSRKRLGYCIQSWLHTCLLSIKVGRADTQISFRETNSYDERMFLAVVSLLLLCLSQKGSKIEWTKHGMQGEWQSHKFRHLISIQQREDRCLSQGMREKERLLFPFYPLTGWWEVETKVSNTSLSFIIYLVF